MAKRPKRQSDDDRTELLGLDELFVLKGLGDQNNYFAWQHEYEPECCPLCGGDVIKIQDHFSKTYTDYIDDGGRPRMIRLNYEFFKYRCLNDHCRHIFANQIGFASKNDRVTFRLENEISRMVMEGYSYYRIQELFQNTISRQAVGQIFHRWVKKKEALRRMQMAPVSLAILEGHAGETEYTLVLSLDDDIRVFDVLLGVNSIEIGHVLRKIGPGGIKTVISDCSPVINDAITDYIPDALHIIPVEIWFRLVSDDFQSYAHKTIRWSSVRKKDELIMIPRADLGYRVSDLEKLLDDRPKVRPVYVDFNDLRALIERRGELWVFDELQEWADSICDDSKECMAPSLYLLQAYQRAIEAQTQHRDIVPNLLADYVSQLEELLSQAKTFSEDILKARVLYVINTDLYDWRGVPVQDVIRTLQDMDLATKRKRRESYDY